MAAVPPHASSRTQTERTIAAVRVLLAISSLFAIWLDPAEPERYATTTYTLHLIYVSYSLVIATVIFTSAEREGLGLGTHIADIAAFSVFQYLTLGPSSPFFVYFVFSLFCGAMRWGWRGTLRTAAIVLVAFLTMGAYMSRTLGPSAFELNRFIIRTVYLMVTAGLLVYLGRYQERLRHDIEQLARWPPAIGASVEHVIKHLLRYSAEIVGAGRALAVWEAGEEPEVQSASWSADSFSLTRESPAGLQPFVHETLADTAFLALGTLPGDAPVLAGDDDRAARPLHLHASLQARLAGVGLTSAPFRTERVSGRVFFTDLGMPTAEIVPLTEAVARQLGASLDQVYISAQLRRIAASEERIRVARDLHDGVLQSLTGIRLEIRAVATALSGGAGARERLVAIERALAIEQRELRFFIADLRPSAADGARSGTLAGQLHALRDRIALEWKAPVTVRVEHGLTPLPPQIEQAVPLMVHEAVVNALKHGAPSRVSVTVDGGVGYLRLVVTDDGRGFAFRGQLDHAALVQSGGAPKSLLERVTAFSGQLSVESSDAGSRVEMVLPIPKPELWPSV